LKTFVKVAELGSYTRAAHHLKQPKSRVSRAIIRLEEETRVELIKRTTRSISLTEAGQELFNKTKNLLRDLEDQVESIVGESGQIQGTLSLSAPVDFGENILPPLLCDFSKVHPEVKCKVILSDSYMDLSACDIDLALRVGNLKDSSLKQRRLAESEFVLVASSDYCRTKGQPQSFDELKDHHLISFFNENQKDPLKDVCKKHNLTLGMTTNSFPLIKKLVMESHGVGILPSVICKEQLKSGEMRRVLAEWSTGKSAIQLIYRDSKNMAPKTRAFIDFLWERKEMFKS